MKLIQEQGLKLTMVDVSVDEIIKIVANHFGFEEDFHQLITREMNIIHAKHIAIFLIRKNYPKMTLASIGTYFAGKKEKGLDHATILNAIRKIKNFIDIDKSVSEDVKFLQDLINLKKNSNTENIKIDKNYYYICLNNINSIKIGNGKAIITTGLSNSEIEVIKKTLDLISLEITEEREHKNTEMYILESKKND